MTPCDPEAGLPSTVREQGNLNRLHQIRDEADKIWTGRTGHQDNYLRHVIKPLAMKSKHTEAQAKLYAHPVHPLLLESNHKYATCVLRRNSTPGGGGGGGGGGKDSSLLWRDVVFFFTPEKDFCFCRKGCLRSVSSSRVCY
jgi:hypothetical protein